MAEGKIRPCLLQMKTAFLSASLSRQAGGIFEIELALAHHLERQEIDVTALGLEDHEWHRDQNRWQGVHTTAFKARGPKVFGHAPGMLKAMLDARADVAHLHYMWMYPSVAIHQWHRQTGKPYVVTPNGMLEPWALRNSAWKKKLAGFLYEDRMLRGAACLHANTEKELRDIRVYGLKNPIAVIPNGVDLPLEESEGRKVEGRRSGERKILLFLGRLHPKKGLLNALRAWNKLRRQESGIGGREEWQFVVAGWDQGGHETELKRLCDELGLAYADIPAAEFVADSLAEREHLAPMGTSGPARRASPTVLFLGPAFGEVKDALLRQASAFILPSFSEGLPMSVLEAWSYRLPVLMTVHCNLPEGFTAAAAIRIGTDVEGITEGMRLLLQSPISDLQSLGENGRHLVEQHFTWPQVAAQMKEVYEWVLGGGAVPGCVREF